MFLHQKLKILGPKKEDFDFFKFLILLDKACIINICNKYTKFLIKTGFNIL